MSLLEVKGLATGYGRLPVVRGVDLRVDPDELVAVVGPNGAGKTSLAKAIFGLLPVLEGEVSFIGESLARASVSRRRQLGMSMVPQVGNTFADLSVEDNLTVSFSTFPDDVAVSALEAAFAMFPRLDERRAQLARTLSGGERQMLAFASGAAARPRFLLLDEPTTGLAPTVVKAIVDKILEFRSEGASILWIIEENPIEVLPYVDRVYVMNNGGIRAEMPAADLLVEGALRELFFGAAED